METIYGKIPHSYKQKLFFALDIKPDNRFHSKRKFYNYVRNFKNYLCVCTGKVKIAVFTDASGDTDYAVSLTSLLLSKEEVMMALYKARKTNYFDNERIDFVLEDIMYNY